MPDATPIRIINTDDLKQPHVCTSQDILTDIRISVAKSSQELIGVGANLQELSARFEEQNKFLMEFIRSQSEKLKDIEAASKSHECKYADQIRQNTEAVNAMKQIQAQQSGEAKWTDRIIGIFQAVVIAAVVALILWFMKGGAIN